jgi:aconitate hydratase
VRSDVPEPVPWRAAQTLELVDAGQIAIHRAGSNGKAGLAVVCTTLDEVRDLASRAAEIAPTVRAVLAAFIPSGTVALLSGYGIAAIELDAASAKGLRGQRTIALPAPSQWAERASTPIAFGNAKVPLTWLALGAERAWAGAGSASGVSGGTKRGR